ncbi:hypothetical protein CVT24_005271 [Panaeolus cyanescens]|uniref:MYND-type domain-containing protein n=1 Tax=Panaeolus cyanescens TaxID=181874 RepID=A0A409Y8V0_9AGAR|nr:hypothetical protein CVT24_005271 [Panaeolus cyanescens]
MPNPRRGKPKFNGAPNRVARAGPSGIYNSAAFLADIEGADDWDKVVDALCKVCDLPAPDLTTRSGLKKVHANFGAIYSKIDKVYREHIDNHTIRAGVVGIYAKMCEDHLLRNKLFTKDVLGKVIPLLHIDMTRNMALQALNTITHHGGADVRTEILKHSNTLTTLLHDFPEDEDVGTLCVSILAHCVWAAYEGEHEPKYPDIVRSLDLAEILKEVIEATKRPYWNRRAVVDHAVSLAATTTFHGAQAFKRHHAAVKFLVAGLRSKDWVTRGTCLGGILRLYRNEAEEDQRLINPMRLMDISYGERFPPRLNDALTKYGPSKCEIYMTVSTTGEFASAMIQHSQSSRRDLYALGLKLAPLILRTEFSVTEGLGIVNESSNGTQSTGIDLPYKLWGDALPHCARAIREQGKPNEADLADILDIKWCLLRQRFPQATEYAQKGLERNPNQAYFYYTISLMGNIVQGLGAAKKGLKCKSITPFVKYQLMQRAVEHAGNLGIQMLQQSPEVGDAQWEEGVSCLMSALEDAKAYIEGAPPDNRYMKNVSYWFILLTVLTKEEISPDLRELQDALRTLSIAEEFSRFMATEPPNTLMRLSQKCVVNNYASAMEEFSSVFAEFDQSKHANGQTINRKKLEDGLAAWLKKLDDGTPEHHHGVGCGHFSSRATVTMSNAELYRCTWCGNPSACLRKCKQRLFKDAMPKPKRSTRGSTGNTHNDNNFPPATDAESPADTLLSSTEDFLKYIGLPDQTIRRSLGPLRPTIKSAEEVQHNAQPPPISTDKDKLRADVKDLCEKYDIPDPTACSSIEELMHNLKSPSAKLLNNLDKYMSAALDICHMHNLPDPTTPAGREWVRTAIKEELSQEASAKLSTLTLTDFCRMYDPSIRSGMKKLHAMNLTDLLSKIDKISSENVHNKPVMDAVSEFRGMIYRDHIFRDKLCKTEGFWSIGDYFMSKLDNNRPEALEELSGLSMYAGDEIKTEIVKHSPTFVKLLNDFPNDDLIGYTCVSILGHCIRAVYGYGYEPKYPHLARDLDLPEILKAVIEATKRPYSSREHHDIVQSAVMLVTATSYSISLNSKTSPSLGNFLLAGLRSKDRAISGTCLVGLLRLFHKVAEKETENKRALTKFQTTRGSLTIPTHLATHLKKSGLTDRELDINIEAFINRRFASIMRAFETVEAVDRDFYDLGMKIVPFILQSETAIMDGPGAIASSAKPGLPFTLWGDALPCCAQAIRDRGKANEAVFADILDIKWLLLRNKFGEAINRSQDALKRHPDHAYFYYALIFAVRAQNAGIPAKDVDSVYQGTLMVYASSSQGCNPRTLTPFLIVYFWQCAVECSAKLALIFLLRQQYMQQLERPFSPETPLPASNIDRYMGEKSLQHVLTEAKDFLDSPRTPPDIRFRKNMGYWYIFLTVITQDKINPDLREIQDALKALSIADDFTRVVAGEPDKTDLRLAQQYLVNNFASAVQEFGNVFVNEDMDRIQEATSSRKSGLRSDADILPAILQRAREMKEAAQETNGSPLAKDAVLHRCASCGAPSAALRRCSGCAKTHYCDAACQKQHWSEHKKACKAAQRAAKTST